MSQSHFTLAFPLKAPADTQALTDQLTAQMPALIKTAELDRYDPLRAVHDPQSAHRALLG